MLIHRIAVALALLAYAVDRDDIVWRIAPWNTPSGIERAHVIFAVAGLVAGLGAVLIQRRRPLGTLLVAVGMSALLSPLGVVILLVAETWRAVHGPPDRTAIVGWAWALTMLVFAVALKDWLAWTCASVAIGCDLLFNRGLVLMGASRRSLRSP